MYFDKRGVKINTCKRVIREFMFADYPQQRSVVEQYVRNFKREFSQPSKIVSQCVPDLHLHTDWVMPLKQSPVQWQYLFQAYGWEGISKKQPTWWKAVYTLFQEANPAIADIPYHKKNSITLLWGMVSAFNMDDITEFIAADGTKRSAKYHQTRRQVEQDLGVMLSWVPSNATLNRMMEYAKTPACAANREHAMRTTVEIFNNMYKENYTFERLLNIQAGQLV